MSMTTTMAFHGHLPCPLFLLLANLLARVFAANDMYPFNCTQHINTCNASLYHINTGLQKEQIASFYSVNASQISHIPRVNKQDYLITVPCSCKDINGTTGYFYDTSYTVQQGDTFSGVSDKVYNGQAWRSGGGEVFVAGENVTMDLLCGCVESETQVVVTYTVEQGDTLSDIATLLSSNISSIESINKRLLNQNPGFIDVGWVLFVPMEKNGIPAVPAPKEDQ